MRVPLRSTRSERAVPYPNALSGLRGFRLTGFWQWLAPVIATVLVMAGVGWAIWPSQPGPVPLHLTAGTVQADLLTPAQVSRIAGTTVVSELGSSQPPPALSVAPAKCAAVAGPATQSVYGHAWSAFQSATDQDSMNSGDYTVSQAVGLFPGGAAASTAFRTLASGLAECSSSTTRPQDGQKTAWTYKAAPAGANAVSWTATQTGGLGWTCDHQVQLKGNAVVQAAVCEYGDGRSTVAALATALSGKVSQ